MQSAGGVTIKIKRVLDAQGHALLSCHSPAREQKDRAIDDTKAAGFEAALAKLQEGLSKPRGTKDVAKIMELLGCAKQRYARAAQHYGVEISKDASGALVQAITWTKTIKPASAAMHPGVYCLRTTLVDLDNATLWRSYSCNASGGRTDKSAAAAWWPKGKAIIPTKTATTTLTGNELPRSMWDNLRISCVLVRQSLGIYSGPVLPPSRRYQSPFSKTHKAYSPPYSRLPPDN